MKASAARRRASWKLVDSKMRLAANAFMNLQKVTFVQVLKSPRALTET